MKTSTKLFTTAFLLISIFVLGNVLQHNIAQQEFKGELLSLETSGDGVYGQNHYGTYDFGVHGVQTILVGKLGHMFDIVGDVHIFKLKYTPLIGIVPNNYKPTSKYQFNAWLIALIQSLLVVGLLCFICGCSVVIHENTVGTDYVK